MRTVSITLVSILLICSCASQPPVLSERFVAVLNEHGMKIFTLDRVFGGDGKAGNGLADEEKQMISAHTVRKRNEQYRDGPPLTRLEELLAETAFCSHGYFILEKSIGVHGSHIRGECKSVLPD